jgi:hypothetical protein
VVSLHPKTPPRIPEFALVIVKVIFMVVLGLLCALGQFVLISGLGQYKTLRGQGWVAALWIRDRAKVRTAPGSFDLHGNFSNRSVLHVFGLV